MCEIRFGLIGTGRHGTRYARHLLAGDIPGGRLTAITRRNHTLGEAQAGDWGVAYHRDAESLATDDSVDAILAVSLSDTHRMAVEAAAAAGKPVLVEKPLATTMAECERVAALAKKTGIPVMVAQTTRYEGVVLGLLQALPSIGPVREVSFSLHSEDRTHENGLFQERLADGGALLDSGIHYFDLLPMLVGPIEAVWCERHFLRETPIDDGYTALFRARSGARVIARMGRWGSSRHEAVEVAGDEGILLLSRTPHSLVRIRGRESESVPFPDVAGTLVPTMCDFLEVCAGRLAPPITIEDGMAAVALVDACTRSRGSWIKLP